LDNFNYVHGSLVQIASVETKFQTIDIYDFIEPRFSSMDVYQRSLSKNGSYESLHPDLHRPNRILFLDGVMQSQRKGEAEYHEALVHPAMFTHKYPKRVAIIGGGEGATLREVLKHNTVEEVIMIEIDELMVNLSRTFLPEWNDCSDLVGSEPCCFDDPRATIYYEDALQWFINRYTECNTEIMIATRFDVIIMDAL
jgi:spermidine synthase